MAVWMHRTRAGPVYIVPKHGRFHVIYDEQDLGSYHSPAAAADDVAGGHTFSPSNGVDLGELGISYDLIEWEHR
jgi:hypothetical protein